MKPYVITGKKGSFAELITKYVNEQLDNIEVKCLSPSEIDTEHSTVILINIPFSSAWDWYMFGDIHNKEKLHMFNDEIMEFRNLDKFDYKIDFDGGVDWKSAAEQVVRVIKEDSNDSLRG